jgi:hypothetical protein
MNGSDQHVIPEGDLREHIAAWDCWCVPIPDDECPEVAIHNALDGRPKDVES